MTLTKAQRAALFDMFRGRCAYCGCELNRRWHADHVEPVGRRTRWVGARVDPVTKKWQPGHYEATGQMDHPERDCWENLMPACHLCNIDKSNLSLEFWRATIQRKCEVLRNNYSAYRHALRFGMIEETGVQIRFHFEQALPRRPVRTK